MRRNRALVVAALTLAATAIALDYRHTREPEPRLLEPSTPAAIDAGGYGSAPEDAPGYSVLPGAEPVTEAGGYGAATGEEDSYGAAAGGYGTPSADTEYEPGDD